MTQLGKHLLRLMRHALTYANFKWHVSSRECVATCVEFGPAFSCKQTYSWSNEDLADPLQTNKKPDPWR